jgi:nitrogenase molybdenum-iron protein NifN
LIAFLTEISGRPAPAKYRRQRGQLVDAMLDGHFHIGGRKLAIGAEPDLLYDVGSFLHEMGAHIEVAITTTQSPVLEKVPAEEVVIGDLEDLEFQARDKGCDLFVTHSHGRQAAARLKIPFHRLGIPMFDRLGAGHKLSVGYRGGRDLIFQVANLIMADREENHEVTTETWRNPWGPDSAESAPEEAGAAIATSLAN